MPRRPMVLPLLTPPGTPTLPVVQWWDAPADGSVPTGTVGIPDRVRREPGARPRARRGAPGCDRVHRRPDRPLLGAPRAGRLPVGAGRTQPREAGKGQVRP